METRLGLLKLTLHCEAHGRGRADSALWLARLEVCVFSPLCLLSWRCDLWGEASLPGENDRGELLDQRFSCGHFPFLELPTSPMMSWWLHCACAKRHFFRRKHRLYGPLFHVLFCCSPYSAMQCEQIGLWINAGLWVVARTKRQALFGKWHLFSVFSWKPKNLSFLSGIYFPCWNHGKYFQFIR